jgi:hypothetical protein
MFVRVELIADHIHPTPRVNKNAFLYLIVQTTWPEKRHLVVTDGDFLLEIFD